MKSPTTGMAAMAAISAILLQVSGGATTIWAQSLADLPVLHTVKGEVSSVVGEFHMAKNSQGQDILDIFDRSYFITNQAGETVRLELTDHTKVESRVNPGDRVEAKISEDGYTLSVIRVK